MRSLWAKLLHVRRCQRGSNLWLLLSITAVLYCGALVLANSLGGQETPHVSWDPHPTDSDKISFTFDASVDEGVSCTVPDYDRGDWKHWEDEDHDCQDTRQEVLARQSDQEALKWDNEGCKVASGRWTCPYTGEVFTNPRDLDVDHMVPLANAHVSGGWWWTAERKQAYANDLNDPCHLWAVKAAANRSKGKKAPDEWLPDKDVCSYVGCWLQVKVRSGLTLSAREARKVAEVYAECSKNRP
jgi:hypothetical protein